MLPVEAAAERLCVIVPVEPPVNVCKRGKNPFLVEEKRFLSELVDKDSSSWRKAISLPRLCRKDPVGSTEFRTCGRSAPLKCAFFLISLHKMVTAPSEGWSWTDISLRPLVC